MITDADLRTGNLTMGNRPGLILVDLSLGFSSPNSPLGGDFQAVLDANKQLLSVFRENNWPVYFTSVVYFDDETASVFRQRLPDLNLLRAGSDWVEIHPSLERQASEVIIEKQWPSAFFHTNLSTRITADDIDCLVVTGLTTSGCVRATAVDGLQHNYPVFVPRQACGDRNHSAHEASLHDIHAKYGNVLEMSELLALLSPKHLRVNPNTG